MNRPSPSRGFTLLELTITSALIMLLLGSVFAVFGEMIYFMNDKDSRYAFTLNSSMALNKLDGELRKIGWADVGGTRYPFLSSDSDVLHFVRLGDPPCDYNGTGELIWNETEYTLKVEDGILGIWEGPMNRANLCAGVDRCTFSIVGKKLTVDLVMNKLDERGRTITDTAHRVIVMHN